MIPRLNNSIPTSPEYKTFIRALRKTDFSGDICCDFSTRLITATDNSIYQILPEAVVFPKSQDDIVVLFNLGQRTHFQGITFSPRGGGTGTNGQSLSTGIIIDCSRHMNNILEINLEEQWVRVEPGVVLDQLNEELRPHEVFFAPNLSPSSRATLGGMINTDACGKGSRIYGRTSDHVLELSGVLVNGETFSSCPQNLGDVLSTQKGRMGEAVNFLQEVSESQSELIKKKFPKMSRFMSGYNLAKLHDSPGSLKFSEQETEDVEKNRKPSKEKNLSKKRIFNLNYLLSGSEGTLAMLTEAKVFLSPLPKHTQLLLVKYESFDDALSSAEQLLAFDPAAIETIDDTILSLAKEDEIYPQIKDFITDEGSRKTRAINLIEFSGVALEDVETKIQGLCTSIDSNKSKEHEATGFYWAKQVHERASLWELRKKGVGLLGNAPGNRKPIPFMEDTAVPPEHLADYIRDLKALLESHKLDYAMFGHVDVGCLHVRPALDMKDSVDEKRVREISDAVVALLQHYGGVMWAEHGRGFRSEYTPHFFGEELHQTLRKVKEVFDPHNQLNPGKLVTPYSHDSEVLPLESPLRGHQDRQISSELQAHYKPLVDCNGNGACFHYSPEVVICPSYKVTHNRLHSPKGRAGMMREWLRQWSLSHSEGTDKVLPVVLLEKTKNSLKKAEGEQDFSHDVYKALAECLACKACASQCPIHVDIPEFRSHFLELYHSRYLRPVRDYLVGYSEFSGKWMSEQPAVFNALLKLTASRWLMKQLGLQHMPAFSPVPLKKRLQKQQIPKWNPDRLRALSIKDKQKSVILLQDAFTGFYESQVVMESILLFKNLGYTVYMPPFHANGKPLHIKGFLKKFTETVKQNTRWLNDIAKFDIPIVVLDPAIALTYRDEYQRVLKESDSSLKADFEILLPQEWLLSQKKNLLPHNSSPKDLPPSHKYTLLGHCSEKAGALLSQEQWKQVFTLLGLELKLLPVGCCGMAGVYGHEVEHQSTSKGIYDLSWKAQIPADPFVRQNVLVTGFSCRSQVQRFENFRPMHPLQALLRALKT